MSFKISELVVVDSDRVVSQSSMLSRKDQSMWCRVDLCTLSVSAAEIDMQSYAPHPSTFKR
jgi:hypothetical protein